MWKSFFFTWIQWISGCTGNEIFELLYLEIILEAGSQTFLVRYKNVKLCPAFIVLSQFKPQSGIQNAELWICVTQDESRKNLT